MMTVTCAPERSSPTVTCSASQGESLSGRTRSPLASLKSSIARLERWRSCRVRIYFPASSVMLRFSKNLFFGNDIAIDLGTTNTLVYVRGRGVVINEPSVVAVNDKTHQVVAVGKDAKTMLGKTPAHIRVVRPLSHGVISDFEVTEELLTYLINKAQGGRIRLFGPRVVIGVPTGVTNVQSRAVRDAAKNAGAREAI